ncbi:tripartite motif-containing protein 2-like [Montipora foliosa]|uniref:tripartite motif-containing protein 2-like n=1 Tax=Montipora foliosa TaxID=591990 RepID=UPI0035F1193B
MDIKTFLDNIYEHVCCSVCTNRFTNPKLLPCLHTFCLHRLQRIQATSGIGDTILCPECRRNFTIPGNGDLSTLLTNFRLNSLLDALPVTECKTKGINCCSFWCDDCLPFHNGIRTNKEHRVLALKDFRDEDFENILKHPPFCAKHGEKLKFFCQVCKTAICYSCAVTDHEGHAKIVLEDAAKERKLRIVRAVEFKKREAQNKVTRIAKLDENCTQVQEEPARIKSDIQKFTNNLIAAIEAKMNEIFQEVEMKAKQCLERLREKRREIEGEMKKDQTVIEESNIILKRSTSAQIMQPNDFLDELFRKEESTVEGKGISEGTVGLKAEIVVKARNIQGKQVHDENNRVTMEIRNHEGHDCSTKPQIHDRKNGNYKISYFAKESGTCQASVKVNGEHVRGSPFKTELKPRLFKPVFSFGKPGSADGMLSGPWGIAVNDKDEIAVTDRDNHRIQTFGHFLRQFGEKGKLNDQLYCPYGLATDSDDNIIVADYYNKSIKIFALDGLFLRKIGEDGSFVHPIHCIQHDNYFIVSDYGGHCIKVFDKQGKFLYKFGGRGRGDGEFYQPFCLSVDRAGHLLVCDSMNHRVQVFKLNGEFVTKFGAPGKEEGKFNQPISTAILSHGRIIVTEYRNDRVQVFE